ncbi:unnamed protein product [Ectocarpus fasciculatus]
MKEEGARTASRTKRMTTHLVETPWHAGLVQPKTSCRTYLAEFVDQDQYLFIAPVSKAFRLAWGPRATVTRPVVADTSTKQLRCCLKLGLPLCIRRTNVCNAAARFGRLDVLKLARKSACGWTPATCAQAAWGGHLEVVKCLRAQGCGWDEEACQLAAHERHFHVLIWVRSSTENLPTGVVDSERRAS